MAGAIMRGLSLSDLDNMTYGQLVDFCISQDEIGSGLKETRVREATQADFNRF